MKSETQKEQWNLGGQYWNPLLCVAPRSKHWMADIVRGRLRGCLGYRRLFTLVQTSLAQRMHMTTNSSRLTQSYSGCSPNFTQSADATSRAVLMELLSGETSYPFGALAYKAIIRSKRSQRIELACDFRLSFTQLGHLFFHDLLRKDTCTKNEKTSCLFHRTMREHVTGTRYGCTPYSHAESVPNS